MRGGEFEHKRRRLARVAFWLGVGLLIAAAMQSIRFTDGDPTVPSDRAIDAAAQRTIRVKQVDLPPTDPSWRAGKRGDFDLIAGATTSIAAEDLPADRPVVLNLILPTARSSADALPARIIAIDRSGVPESPGSAELKLPDAVMGSDRDRVRVEIERDWLSPGRYRIEVETGERPQLSPRHYLLEIH